MAKDPQGDKPIPRTPLTGTAQPVTNTVERVRGFFKDRPEPSRPPSTERKNFRKKPKAEDDEPTPEPQENEPETGADGEDAD